ncbi:hypothetical protein OK016_08100 [Vibrio chagasii]|nr:hypothetical protein [Vibrio chagasii]
MTTWTLNERQVVSIAASTSSSTEHDDANRALMERCRHATSSGTNAQG